LLRVVAVAYYTVVDEREWFEWVDFLTLLGIVAAPRVQDTLGEPEERCRC
jgi:hypothetical protein